MSNVVGLLIHIIPGFLFFIRNQIGLKLKDGDFIFLCT